MKVISYEDWKKQVEIAHEDEELEGCDICQGEGIVECDMGHEHDCEECGGMGGVGVDLSQRAYAKAIAKDLQALLNWCGRLPADIEDQAGLSMVVYTDIKTRELRIVA
ncbi:hypothetical protein [uncultured Gilvimarinus sp.]|uniref:hypothetical protein n=1 Tax=uncultured Gilvimarinus sp. TaxID=1689143 RepID=UPI0030EBC1DB